MLMFIVLAILQTVWCCKHGKYTIGQSKLNWHEAFISCGQNGLELATVASEQEQEAIESALNKCGVEKTGTNHGFWISAMLLGEKPGKWFWFSHQTGVTYTKWAPSQPDFFAIHERCVEIFKNDDGQFYWNDLQCDPIYVRKRYVCQEKANVCRRNDEIEK